MSPTLKGLQTLINICVRYGRDLNISFNHSKTQYVISGTSRLPSRTLILDGTYVLPQDTLKHLGFNWKMKTGKLKLTHHLEYRINEMWSVVSSLISSGVRFLHPNQIITLHQSLVVPKLLYGIEILHLTATDREHLNRQSRSALKQLFGVSKHAKNLIDRYYRLDSISTQLDKRRLNVIHQLTQNNDTWNYVIYMLSIPNQKRNFSILNSLYKTCVEHSTDFVKCLLNRTKNLIKLMSWNKIC